MPLISSDVQATVTLATDIAIVISLVGCGNSGVPPTKSNKIQYL